MDIREIKKKTEQPEYAFLKEAPLGDSVILLGLGGSYAYGTNNEDSDLDIRGIATRSAKDILTGKDSSGTPVDRAVDVGTYTVTATAVDNGNYVGTSTQIFEINQANLPAISAIPSAVYNGEDQTFDGTVTPSSESTLFDASKVTYTGATSVTGKNVGEYKADIDITKASYADTDNFEVTFIEAMNTEVLKTVFGDSNVTEASGAITINVNNSAKANYIYVIDMLLKGNRAKRIVIPNGAISEVGETVYADDDVISYPVTITALADSSGNTHYEYIAAA